MPETWTRSVRLHLELDPAVRPARALTQALRQAITTGVVAAGTPLPSTRTLAGELGLARGTVVEAYDQLAAEGYLLTRPRAGTRVAAGVTAPVPAPALPSLGNPPRHDFRPVSSDASAFPRTAWSAAMRAAIRDATDDDLRYGDPRGHPELRAALASYLGRVRGVRTEPDRILVCGGYAHGLALLCRVYRRNGWSRIAIEDPGFTHNRRSAEYAGLTTVPVPMDGDGLRVDALPSSVDATVVTPAHHLPLGVTLAPASRTALVRWAGATGGLIWEDDYDGELRYDRQPIGALQGLAPERVVYLGTASKSLAPVLRLGWLVLPAALVDAVVEERRQDDRHAPTFDQLALARLITSGGLDRHLRRMRPRYRRRRDLLISAIRDRVPAITVEGVAAGYHALLRLPATTDESATVAALARAGVAVPGLSEYTASGRAAEPGLLVGYGTPPQHRYAEALDALTNTLATTVRRS
ncbi:aminotransferase-like domain-containing protein [Flindersiella endophytica]